MNNFITKEIDKDILEKNIDKVIVRFPPEPNGYLHLGHAKSIIINSEIARKYNGILNLRFDDTNPDKENIEYVNAIKEDAFWLADNFNNITWTSNYFDNIYDCAILLIKKGLAYVDDHSIEEIKEMRGNFYNKGIKSEYRNRTVEENLKLFNEMKNGKFKEEEKVLRAKIDMDHENMNMRDPVIYRIRKTKHHNTGDKWCIYPLYDFAHPISDGIEGITHSLCTLEFENHRILYDWFIENCKELLKSIPKELEFSELNVEGILLSKRKLNNLIEERKVENWSDPVLPTISGLRKRGFTPELLRNIVDRIGVTKVESITNYELIEEVIRDTLANSERTMSIINPIELEIENYNNYFDKECKINIPLNPRNKDLGDRVVNLSSKIYVEETDISLNPDKNFWRIYEGNTIRLKNGYNIIIKKIISKDNKPIKVIGEIDYESKNMKKAKVKAKVALHWLSDIDAEKINLIKYKALINKDKEINNNFKNVKEILIHKDLKDKKGFFEFERSGYYFNDGFNIHLLAKIKNFK
tara:strand:+ start:3790 stop:5367 length:1578 start_codon:yes stop_codon:yes gene_type:complete